MIYGPMSGTMANPYPFYHEALHLVVNPIVQENRQAIEKLKDLFEISKDKRSDVYVSIEDLVSESFVRTLDKVLYGEYAKKQKDEIREFVENEYRMGHILSLLFYEKLAGFENSNQRFSDFCRNFLKEIDVESEKKRWEKYK